MNRKMSIKITLDITMLIVYLLLLNPHETGLVFHEIAGLLAAALFVFHIVLNWTWVRNLTRFALRAKTAKKPILMSFVNLGLFLCIGTAAITGILISRIIFPTVTSESSNSLVAVHNSASYLGLSLILAHILLHRKYLLSSFRNIIANGERRLALALGVGLIMGIIFDRNILGSNTRLVYPPNPPTVSLRSSGNSLNKDNRPQGKTPNSNSTFDNTQGNNQISLSDYLGHLFCTGCGKHCSLLSPGCNRSEAQVQAAVTDYKKLYGQDSNDSSTGEEQENDVNNNNYNNYNNYNNTSPTAPEENNENDNFFRNGRTFKGHGHKGGHETRYRA